MAGAAEASLAARWWSGRGPKILMPAPEEVLPPDWLDGYATARVWEARKRGRAIRSFLEHEEKAVMAKVRYNLERTSFLDEVSLAGNATGGDRMQSRGRLERKLSAIFFLDGRTG